MTIRDYLKNSNFVPYTLLVTFLGLSGMLILGYCEGHKKTANLSPPVYRDVNQDGVKDKILEKKVMKPGIFIDMPTLQKEVLYGVKVNGKTIFLPKEQFDGLNE